MRKSCPSFWFAGGRGLALLLPAIWGCDGGGDRAPETDARRPEHPSGVQRVFAEVDWDTLYAIGGSLQDTLLLIPRTITAGGGTVYVYDYGDSRLKAFDREGALRWRFGRSGEGPGEFANPMDVEVGVGGDVWVLDDGSNRLTTVSPEGHLRGHIPIGEEVRGRDVVPLDGDVFVTTVSRPGTLWVAVGSDGRVVENGPIPLDEIAEAYQVSPYMIQTMASRSLDGRTWAAVFLQGDLILVYRRHELFCYGRLVDAEPFPTRGGVSQQAEATYWAAGAVVTDSSVFVLANGETEDRLKALDEYAISDCSYRRSLRLPKRSVALAYSDGTFFLVNEDPAPQVLALRPTVH